MVIGPDTILVGLVDLHVGLDSGSLNRLKYGLTHGLLEYAYFMPKLDNLSSFCNLNVWNRYLI